MLLGACFYFLRRASTAVNFIALLGIAIIAVIGLKMLDHLGAGALGALTMGCTVSYIWSRYPEPSIQHASLMKEWLNFAWKVAQPVLFAAVGASLSLRSLAQQGNTVWLSVVVILLALAVRVVVSFGSVSGAQLTLVEKLFIAAAWLPKATVQASIGAIPLFAAQELDNDTFIGYSERILSSAVIAILITAPLGATAIRKLGPQYLKQSQDHAVLTNERSQLSDSFSDVKVKRMGRCCG